MRDKHAAVEAAAAFRSKQAQSANIQSPLLLEESENEEEGEDVPELNDSDDCRDTSEQVLPLTVTKHEMPVYDLCSFMLRNKTVHKTENICLLLQIMFDLCPSNAHVERMVKSLNHIKTTERVKLGQVKLNSLYRVSTNSSRGEDFDPDPIIHHWITLSMKSRMGRA